MWIVFFLLYSTLQPPPAAADHQLYASNSIRSMACASALLWFSLACTRTFFFSHASGLTSHTSPGLDAGGRSQCRMGRRLGLSWGLGLGSYSPSNLVDNISVITSSLGFSGYSLHAQRARAARSKAPPGSMRLLCMLPGGSCSRICNGHHVVHGYVIKKNTYDASRWGENLLRSPDLQGKQD